MFIRKKTLLNMIEVLKGEVVNLKERVSELETLNTSKKINFNIDGKEIGTIIAEKICLASTEPIASFDSNGLTIKGEININGYKEEKQC
ncbi:MAG: hypothetical protein E6300_07580 [Clostridium sp.]|uniref:hypothetical protein n=1 Tax=Clostridium sp. TaxID=1506 RepID=UPI001ED75C4F|nr:hypothetical protein [Clostridium sp.]MBS5886303.1 hypothetical protein [Clostridium sp.]MDU7148334.1 hypothetical protein [Clostridium sp.]MDU7243275.1 hypothetical protein [Clostridium sp.]